MSTTSFTVNIPAALGGTNAYVGFTASTGTGSATQQITSWTYTTP
jgi:Legume lectin domain